MKYAIVPSVDLTAGQLSLYILHFFSHKKIGVQSAGTILLSGKHSSAPLIDGRVGAIMH